MDSNDLEYLKIEQYNDMLIEDLIYELKTAKEQSYYNDKLTELRIEIIKEIISEIEESDEASS